MKKNLFLHNKINKGFLFSLPIIICIGLFLSFKKKTSLQINDSPNIVLIVADDLGYSDLQSYGNKFIHTPHIDALGAEGIRFTDALVTSPICGPSRDAIFTGRYQQRFGDEFMPYEKMDPSVKKVLTHYFAGFHKYNEGLNTLHPDFFISRSKHVTGLPASEMTIAQLLKQKAYATGLVGKWNMGDGEGFDPNDRGFDYSYYFQGALTRYVDETMDSSDYVFKHLPWAFSDIPAWAPRSGATAFRENRLVVKDSGYSTLSFAEKSIRFIEKNKEHPFFLALTFNAPHDPFQVPKKYFNRIQNVSDTVKRVYYGMIEALDDAVGMVVEKLKKEGLDQNTLIIFISDNGGATYTRATDNAPLRGGKCTHFEGGLEVPMFIKFPKKIDAGKVYSNAVSSLDIFATIAATAGIALPGDREYDGIDLIPYLQKENTSKPHQTFYWRNGFSKAIRKDNWKLYINTRDKKLLLFNLQEDRSEKSDLAHVYPEKVKELQALLKQWEKTKTQKPGWPSLSNVTITVDGEQFDFPT